MSWFLIIFFLSFSLISDHLSVSEGRHVKKLPSAVVVGTVYCDTCFQDDFSKASHFIAGATVSVECRDGKSKPSFQQEVKTDGHGEFKVHLPFRVSKHVKRIKGCSVKLVSSSEPYCAVAATATSSSLHLKSRKQGTHIFSAGFFTFKPLKQPNVCNQKPSLQDSTELNSQKSLLPPGNDPSNFPPPIQDPTTPDLPPLNILPPLPLLPKLPPLPELPPLPPLSGLPNKPEVRSKPAELSDQKVAQPDFLFPPLLPPILPGPPPLIPNPFQPPPLIPNPFQPPPAPLIPNPFQPPPAPAIPNPFQPPPAPAPIFPFPPIPGLTPSPPPPPPPSLLPPFPFPPVPRIPGIPPASPSPKNLSP